MSIYKWVMSNTYSRSFRCWRFFLNARFTRKIRKAARSIDNDPLSGFSLLSPLFFEPSLMFWSPLSGVLRTQAPKEFTLTVLFVTFDGSQYKSTLVWNGRRPHSNGMIFTKSNGFKYGVGKTFFFSKFLEHYSVAFFVISFTLFIFSHSTFNGSLWFCVDAFFCAPPAKTNDNEILAIKIILTERKKAERKLFHRRQKYEFKLLKLYLGGEFNLFIGFRLLGGLCERFD